MKPITLDEVLQLPVPERIRIVEVIWDSIADTPEAVELTDEQKAELDRRLENLEKNPNAGSPWSEVRERIWHGKRASGSYFVRKRRRILQRQRSGTNTNAVD
jgi:putative addiction module component (TIGR02574 family)